MLNRRIARLFAQLYRDQAGGGDGQGASAGGGGGAAGAGAGQGDAGGQAGAGGGSGAGAAGAGGAGSGSGGAGSDGTGAGAGEKSLFADAAGGVAAGAAAAGAAAAGGKEPTAEEKALQAAEKDTRRPAHVPSKYWDAEKGAIRDEAAFKSLTQLEQRMRDTGLPPKSPDEYKIDMPAPLKEAGIELDQTSTKAFQAKAHALGLTQKQYEGVMAEFFQQIPNIADNATNYGSAKLKTELLAHYKTPEAVQENISLAFKVVRAYGDEKEVEALMGAAGNAHPAWLRIMAKVGKELGEDTAVNPEEVLGGDSLEHLMRGSYGKEDSPYWNKEDPRHAATVQKVTAYHERQSQAAQRRRGA